MNLLDPTVPQQLYRFQFNMIAIECKNILTNMQGPENSDVGAWLGDFEAYGSKACGTWPESLWHMHGVCLRHMSEGRFDT
ncbi:hypothetical protein O6P43_019927 [Quillaja saponaria]|uniref:Uncharacterized protein n=1 Tax=Quillaja saponaria TaxID=32244 RepID=A0AAD7LLP2_QUISA|nr:hypothetical protein O6P43_019927 [Quillaja saponaria]